MNEGKKQKRFNKISTFNKSNKPHEEKKKRHTFPISGMKMEHLRSYRFFFFKIIGILKLVYVNRFEI